MGIQGLARRLEPYATRYSPKQLHGYSAVIDGPALAYYAHRLALATCASAARIPSYSDINAEAIRWLKSLESININVAAIFFDGALPESKRVERLSRTEHNNRRVQQLRKTYAGITCPIPTYLGAISYAFLAPALREALQASNFSDKTHVVPGEADDWCALHAKDNARSIIFTSDSDLVLYDYCVDTLIVFLHDADISADLKAYSPGEIREKLQLSSLVPFAFVVNEGPQNTAQKLPRLAQDVNLDSAQYMEFSNRYVAQVAAPVSVSDKSGSPVDLPQLDVRTSEFVHQVLEGAQNPLVYMPLLVEDPDLASAWNSGCDIRKLAYSLLAPSNMVVLEYRRKAQGIAAQEMPTYQAGDVPAPVAELEQQVSMLAEWAALKEIGPTLFWPLFALSLVLAEGKSPPTTDLVLRIVNGVFDETWAFVHLAARIQAALYSLRMFGQIAKVWLLLNPTPGTKLYDLLSSLDKHMENLPPMPELFGVPGQAKRVLAKHEELENLVDEIYKSVGIELPTEIISNKKKKRLAREADRKKRKAEQRQQMANANTGS
ncbi:XPG-I-2 domain containing protein [Pyrenophora tritici-repentis]|uniref:XPG domain containing n=2 Tax=Pyrenophora tritici-repentis TaxID=45151 RepID=A0A922NNU7_9PLEO|nr:uncharacterized protein PTRG_08567 [Pyrenophora tritici-repentis Pt-1C-BFP]KAG9379679.1 XPG-I-2 domain containing protein [Pyrenophora tritici-repentis]EDU51486.1 conserved hypothetical protein [Pyrenophora tritici-repentis Pt-1C-BFP]KAI0571351.1 XPG-I-2 domain-containing protein [Pyrenophora tritici-repentis]KAI0577453.1 XPG-I-2 domain-containing protein [Pyrenophora tritici-repentis]KAI0615132.1 XPG-I-2 domain-containing protein [Pyrenophora tritici-repentis]